MSWRNRAACLGQGELFDEAAHLWSNSRATLEARGVCATCPVRAHCLEDALARPSIEDAYGIYGGLDPKQRNEIRKRRAA